MKRITRLSLALIMFALFSISYFVTSVSAQNCAEMGNPAAVASCWAQQTNTPGHPAGLIAPADISHCANLEATAARPACEAAAHSNIDAPAPFDDGLMGKAPQYNPGTAGGAPGYAQGTQGHAPTDGNSIQGGDSTTEDRSKGAEFCVNEWNKGNKNRFCKWKDGEWVLLPPPNSAR